MENGTSALPRDVMTAALSKTGDCRNVLRYCATSRESCTDDMWREWLLAWYNARSDNPKAEFADRCRGATRRRRPSRELEDFLMPGPRDTPPSAPRRGRNRGRLL